MLTLQLPITHFLQEKNVCIQHLYQTKFLHLNIVEISTHSHTGDRNAFVTSTLDYFSGGFSQKTRH